jgi:hypothetical protein
VPWDSLLGLSMGDRPVVVLVGLGWKGGSHPEHQHPLRA